MPEFGACLPDDLLCDLRAQHVVEGPRRDVVIVPNETLVDQILCPLGQAAPLTQSEVVVDERLQAPTDRGSVELAAIVF